MGKAFMLLICNWSTSIGFVCALVINRGLLKDGPLQSLSLETRQS